MAEAVTNTETGYCDYNSLPEGSAYQGPIKVDIQEDQQGLHISLRTARLAIETIRAQDINDYETLFTDERVMKTYASGEAKKAGEISKRILGSWIPRWEKKDPFSGMVIRTHEGEFIGHIAMGYGDAMKYGDKDDGYSEIAYVIAEKHWDKGYGKEAVAALVNGLAPQLIQAGYTVGTCEDSNGKEVVRQLPLKWIVATSRIDRDNNGELVNPASIKILTGLNFKCMSSEEKYGHQRGFFALKV